MKASDIPTKFPIPFAQDATATYSRTIPETTADPFAASLEQGFPPGTFTPVGGGGQPPDGRDVNGVLNQSTSWDRWFSAGGPVAYDSAFQTAIGGYPSGALVASATTVGIFWLSTVDDNTTNPDTGGAGWRQFAPGFNAFQVFASSGTFTIPAGVTRLYVEAWGGGGGGSGNAANTAGGAGGGGAYGAKLLTGLTPGSTVTVTVGAGGPGGAAGANNGTNGGTTSFGGLLSVAGGSGGVTASGGNTPGGAAPTADIAIRGGAAMGSAILTGTVVGIGGDSPRGGSGGPSTNSGGAVGITPGGGGGCGANASSAQPGGAGGDGMVIVWW